MVHTNAALCQLSMYLFVLGIPEYLQVCTKMYPVCTWKNNNKKINGITLEIELRLSCTASCALYHYATSVHSMVTSMVNTRFIATETFTCVALYLLAGVGRPARVQQRPRLRPWLHWSRHRLEYPRCPCWLCKRQTLKAQSWLRNTPYQWSPD